MKTPEPYASLRIRASTRKAIQQISVYTDETYLDVVHRLVCAELARLERQQEEKTRRRA